MHARMPWYPSPNAAASPGPARPPRQTRAMCPRQPKPSSPHMSTTQLGAMSGNSSDTPADAAPTTAQCLRWRPGAIRWPPGIGWWYDHPCALISESMRATMRRCKPLVRGWSPWTPTQRLRLVHRLVYHCSFQDLHAMIWSTFRSCPGSICFHASAWWLHGRMKNEGGSEARLKLHGLSENGYRRLGVVALCCLPFNPKQKRMIQI